MGHPRHETPGFQTGLVLHRANDEEGCAREGDPEEAGLREGTPADGFDRAGREAGADEEEGELEADLRGGFGFGSDVGDERIVEVEERREEGSRGAGDDEPEDEPGDRA